ncbi:MAG: plasmid mobilization protein, partial [Xenococcaceae cyanobacterium]
MTIGKKCRPLLTIYFRVNCSFFMTKTKPKKTTGINIRLTPSEHLHWQLLAHSSGLSVSELVRT